MTLLAIAATLLALGQPQGAPARISSLMVRIERDICRKRSDDPFNTEAAEKEQAIQEMGEDGRQALLRLAADRSKPRACAFRYLVFLDESRVIPVARRVLSDPHESLEFRVNIAGVLSHFRDRESEQRIVELLATTTTKGPIFVSALLALRQYGDDTAKQTLRTMLEAGNVPKAYEPEVILSLGNLRDESAIPLLVNVARGARIQVSARVAEALMAIGTNESRSQAMIVFGTLPSGDSYTRTAREAMLRSLNLQLRSAQDKDANQIRSIVDALR